MPFPGEVLRWAQAYFYGWQPAGFGEPAYYPTAWILLQFLAVIGAVVPAAAFSKCILLLVPALAAASMYIFVRFELALNRFAASYAGLFAATSPAMFNKLVAGQVAYLFAFALLPLWYAFFRARSDRHGLVKLAAAGLVAAIISSQIQFVLMLFIIVVLDPIVYARRSLSNYALSVLVTFSAVCVVQSATIYSVLTSFPRLSASTSAFPSARWIVETSPSLNDSLHLTGYLTHYYENAQMTFAGTLVDSLKLFDVAAYSFFLLMVLGIAFGWGKRGAVFGLALWLLGAVLMSGTRTPVGDLVQHAYAVFRPLQLFRELYHWVALPAFGAGILAAFAIDGIARQRLYVRFLIMAAVILATVELIPAMDGSWSGQLQTINTSPAYARLFADPTPSSQNSRVALLPLEQPIRIGNSQYSGSDPMPYPPNPSLWDYTLVPPVSQLALGLRSEGMEGTADLMRLCGVSNIVLRKSFESDLLRYVYPERTAKLRSFDENALDRGLKRLGWPLVYDSSAYAVYASPYRAAIVESFADYVIISPSPAFIKGLSPAISPVWQTIPYRSRAFAYDAADQLSLVHPIGDNLLSHLSSTETTDAGQGWAGANLWWFYDPNLTDAFDISLVTFERGANLKLHSNRSAGYIVISYVASRKGGMLKLRLPGSSRSILINTRALSRGSSLRTMVFPFEKGPADIVITNVVGDQAIRQVLAVDADEWRRKLLVLRSLLGNSSLLRIRIHGEEQVWIPRTALYQVSNISAVDGKRVAGRYRLVRGTHLLRTPSIGWLVAGHVSDSTPTLQDVRIGTGYISYTGIIPSQVAGIRLRNRFNLGWELRIGGQKISRDHSAGDLFGNSWSFSPQQQPQRFEIVYRPGVLTARLHYLSDAALLLLLAFVVIYTAAIRRASSAWARMQLDNLGQAVERGNGPPNA